jgi:hypothetical protein
MTKQNATKTNKSKSAKGRAPAKTSAAIMSILKRPGALGGRGARTAMIENFIAQQGREGATVSEIETALSRPEILATDVVQSMAQGRVAAIRNHVNTLFVKSLLRRDDSTHKYSVAPAKKGAK